MTKSKYLIENAIALESKYSQLIQQVDFDESSVKNNLKNFPCHLYMICSRPRITIVKDSISIRKDKYELAFAKHYPDKTVEYKCEFENRSGFYEYELNQAGNRIILRDKNGKILTDGKTSLLYPKCITKYDEVLDLKVLYVGQAFGQDGNRMASDRLVSHNTLQKIYSDASSNQPTDEIWCILWQFEPYFLSIFGGASTYNSVFGIEESIENHFSTITSSVPLDQQITVIEAALIKYFKPFYNIEYKTTFPNRSHASYEFCYRLDLNSTCFKLDTIELYTRLYSESVNANMIHMRSYNLHNEAERRDMFKIEL